MNAMQFSNALGKVNDRYIIEAITYERRKKPIRLKWEAMAACLVLIFTVAMATVPGIFSSQGDPVIPNPTVSAPVASDENPSPSVAPTLPARGQEVTINWDNVAVNEAAGSTPDAARRYYDPDLYDMKHWTEAEIVAYYGWNLTPAYIPDGLTTGGNGPGGFLCTQKATGEIVEDHTSRGFWVDFWEDGSPKSDDDIVQPKGFTVTVSKLGIFHCGLLPVDEARTTDFDGVPVTLSHCSMPHGPFDPTQKDPSGLYNMPAGYYDIYTASFTLDGVQYEISAQRLELEQLIRITASVIGMRSEEAFTVGRSQALPANGAS